MASVMSTDKKKAVASAMAGINKQFGLGTINMAGDILDILKIRYYKTPSHEVNTMLGGGVGKGKIVEFFGEPSCGKTSLALEIVAHNQKLDPDFMAGIFETEGSFDPDYATKTFGIDMSRFAYWDQKDSGAEQGLDILRSLVASGQFNILIVNSVAGLTPEKELADDLKKQNIALQARIMSKLMRVICGIANKNGTTLIFINQVRTDVGKMFGDPNTTTGGKALGFYASQRLKMNKIKLDKADHIDEEQGIKISARTAKNRMAKGNPYKVCYYYAIYGQGIDSLCELPDILEREGIVFKSGAWYYWKDAKGNFINFNGIEGKWKSRSAFINSMKDNPKLKANFEEIINKGLEEGTIKGVSMSAEEISMAEKVNEELESFALENQEDLIIPEDDGSAQV